MTQQALFPDGSNSLKRDSTLVISKSKNKILSKEQIAFNKFSQKIESLRQKIENDQIKYDALLRYFSTQVTPVQEAYGHELIQLVKALYAIYKYEKLTAGNKGKMKELILSNLQEAFQYVVPSEEVKAIYDALSPVSFAEEEEEELFLMKEMMEDMFHSKFGIDVDFSDMDMSEEAMAKKMAEIKDQFQSRQEEKNDHQKNRKKSKKEIESELKIKQAEELQKKNIRNIYMSLAKMLHPDLVTDESQKLEREELMKKVTVAYQDKDLHTLLKLEIEIIHKQGENLDHLTDEKLKFLNAALKEQVLELEEELNMLRHHPRYQKIVDYLHYPEHKALLNFDSIATTLAFTQKEIGKDIEELTGKNKMKFITSILKTVSNNRDENFEDMDPHELLELLDMMDRMGRKGRNTTKSKKRR